MDKTQFIQFIRRNGCRVDATKLLAMLDQVIEANFNIDEELIESPEVEISVEDLETIDPPTADDIEGFPRDKFTPTAENLIPIEPLTEEEIQSINNIVKTREEVDPEPKEGIIKLGHEHILNKVNYPGGKEFAATFADISPTGQNPLPFKDHASLGVTLIPEVVPEKMDEPVAEIAE